MTTAQTKEAYTAILNFVKSKGYRVRHRKLTGDLAGCFDPDTTDITIDKKLRGDLEGCYTLAHEYAHSQQFREGTHKVFFEMDNETPYSPENLQIIMQAEQNAAVRGKAMLKTYGLKYFPQELTQIGLLECIKFWKKHYFDMDIS